MDESTPATIARHRASIVTIGIRGTTGAGITIGATGTAGLTAMVGAIVPRATVTVRTHRAPAMIETAAGSFATDTGSGLPGVEPGIAEASSPLWKSREGKCSKSTGRAGTALAPARGTCDTRMPD